MTSDFCPIIKLKRLKDESHSCNKIMQAIKVRSIGMRNLEPLLQEM